MNQVERVRKLSRALAAALVLVCATTLTGCAHQTRVLTIPEGAQAWVDGKTIGRTPGQFYYRSGMPGRKAKVTVRFSDMKTYSKTLTRRLCSNLGNILLDLTLIGILVGFCFEEEVVLEAPTAIAASVTR